MIEKMVLFENQKQLEETRDELERCKRFSFRLYAKELPLELTLSHEENNEVNAVKAILKDMEKGNWPMLRGKSNGLAAGKIKMQRELLHIIWCGSFLFVRSAYP